MDKRRCTCSEKGGRLLRKRWATKSFCFIAVSDIVLESTPIGRQSRCWSLAVAGDVIFDALRASISLLGLYQGPSPLRSNGV